MQIHAQLALGKDRASKLSSDQLRRLVLLLTNGSSWLVYAEIDGTGLFAPYLLSSTEHCIVALIAALFLATVPASTSDWPDDDVAREASSSSL